jgi:hypothetical protein
MFARGVDKLASALDRLNTSLGSLQANSFDALNSIAGTFISFSVMDSDNFDEVMSIVEEKSESLAQLFGTAKEELDKNQASAQFSWTDPSSWWGGGIDTEAGAGEEGEEERKENT